LASVQEIKRKDLLKTGFIARQPGKTDETEKITAVLESWWENYMGTRDNVIFRVRRRSTAFWLVGAGLGVALLPHCSELIPQLEENLYTSVTNVIFRDVPGLDIQSCTYLVMRNPVNNTVLDKLIECVRETLVKGSTVPNDVPFLPFRQSIPSSVRL
jgi:DNA-binding transcriptional LysR family regulator